MGKIFYIMGKSSTGKDTIFKQLLMDTRIKLKTIVPYTTRPIRRGETNGVEYFFSNEEELQGLESSGKLIELRTYDTFHGKWRYFTALDQQIDLNFHDYLMIGTLDSYNKTKVFFGDKKIVPILIELDDGIRLQRALNREKKQKMPKYEEMCRRFLADSADFSKENIKAAGITRIFYNDNLRCCQNEIVDYILVNL
ncbi:MAG TPA: guanylate kinase [Lachnospiraceae bacterium]|nr:guanylate kinase [Lachnospiraceae bacterium]